VIYLEVAGGLLFSQNEKKNQHIAQLMEHFLLVLLIYLQQFPDSFLSDKNTRNRALNRTT